MAKTKFGNKHFRFQHVEFPVTNFYWKMPHNFQNLRESSSLSNEMRVQLKM